jgi:hypothetical protein
MCAVVICRVCRLVSVLQLFVVTSHKRSRNPVINPNPVSGHYYVTDCVRNSETAAVNAGSCKKNESAGANERAGTTTIVGSPHYTTATVMDSDAVGSDTSGCTGGAPHLCTVCRRLSRAGHLCHHQWSDAVPSVHGGGAGTLCTTASGQHYCGKTTAATYSQVTSNSAQGTNAGQLLAQGNGAYLTRQGVDPNMAHTHTAVQRDSSQTVTADGGGIAYMVPGNTTTNLSSLDGGGRRNFSHTTRISPPTFQWLTQNFEVAEGENLPRSTMQSLPPSL